MALRIILTGEDAVLRKKSREVTVFDERLHQLLDDLYETMEEANGVGLAAVQVGILRRAVVIDVGEGRIELINPVITQRSDEKICSPEGCLSFPGETGLVERPKSVTVEALDRNGNFFAVTGQDLLARALCHELDHLDGIIYQDHAILMLDPSEVADEDE
ncbi:MAG: peptide deformylase [Oscillospiraceae bacterium]|nr:peptide deformylase [Oscillospiraceae bacterium]